MAYYLKLIRLSATEAWDEGTEVLFDIHNFVQFLTAWFVLAFLVLIASPLFVALVVVLFPIYLLKRAFIKPKPPKPTEFVSYPLKEKYRDKP